VDARLERYPVTIRQLAPTLGLPGVGFSLPDPLRADLGVMTGEADILLGEEQVG